MVRVIWGRAHKLLFTRVFSPKENVTKQATSEILTHLNSIKSIQKFNKQAGDIFLNRKIFRYISKISDYLKAMRVYYLWYYLHFFTNNPA